MATPEEEHLSPEEKLLRVIQNDGKAEEETSPEEKLASAVAKGEDAEDASGSPPEPAGESVSPTTPVAAKSAEPASPAPESGPPAGPGRPKLKVAAQEPAATAPAGAALGAPEPAAGADPGAAEPVGSGAPLAALPTKRAAGRGNAMILVNRALVAAVSIVALAAAAEICVTVVRGDAGSRNAGAEPAEPDAGLGREALAAGTGGEQTPESLQKVLDAYRKTHIFNWKSGPTNRVVRSGFVAYMQKHIKFLGSSETPAGETEAILADTRLNRMSFVKQGDIMPVQISDDREPEQAKLLNVRPDQVLFECGDRQVIIK